MGVTVVQCSGCGTRYQIDPSFFPGGAKCTKCGAILPSARPAAGASVPPATRAAEGAGTKVCPSCTGVVPLDLAVCVDCGYNFLKGGFEGESRRRAGLGTERKGKSLARDNAGWRVMRYGLHGMFLAGIALCCAALISVVVGIVVAVEVSCAVPSPPPLQEGRQPVQVMARASATAAATLARCLYFIVPMIAVGVGVKFFEGRNTLIWIVFAAYLAAVGMLCNFAPQVGAMALVGSVVALLLLVIFAGVMTLVGLVLCLFTPLARLQGLILGALVAAAAGAAAFAVAGVQGIGASRQVLQEGIQTLAVPRPAAVAIGLLAGFAAHVLILLFLRGVTDVFDDEETRTSVRTYFAFYVSLTGGSVIVAGLNLAGVVPAGLATVLSLTIFAYSVVAFVWFVRVIAAVRDVVR